MSSFEYLFLYKFLADLTSNFQGNLKQIEIALFMYLPARVLLVNLVFYIKLSSIYF